MGAKIRIENTEQFVKTLYDRLAERKEIARIWHENHWRKYKSRNWLMRLLTFPKPDASYADIYHPLYECYIGSERLKKLITILESWDVTNLKISYYDLELISIPYELPARHKNS